jgi:methylenetetrahydrofolate dehydrogenase (NADP+) / methenyltetrahydrofolate cyclohydrolase
MILSAGILDGKKLAAKKLSVFKKKVDVFRKKNSFSPSLSIVQVGKNPASEIYVSKKISVAKEVGINSERVRLPANVSCSIFLEKLSHLAHDDTVDGIILQLPVPKQLQFPNLMELIPPEKDVDGFHPLNQGKNLFGKTGFSPCTPRGVMEILKETRIKIKGKNAVVVGTSNIVGKPLALMLLNAGATVSMCNINTRDISQFTRDADILCVAVGKPGLITGEMVKSGSVVIDIGITRVGKKIFGDVVFDEVKEKVSFLTPVPGGVGPMTVACLMENVLCAAQKKVKK